MRRFTLLAISLCACGGIMTDPIVVIDASPQPTVDAAPEADVAPPVADAGADAPWCLRPDGPPLYCTDDAGYVVYLPATNLPSDCHDTPCSPGWKCGMADGGNDEGVCVQ